MMSKRCVGWLLGLSVVTAAVALQAAAPVAPASQPGTTPATQSFPVPPAGFDQARQNVEKGKVERVEYEAPAVGAGVKRFMQIYTPAGTPRTRSIRCFI